jgi:hypothetical protein
MHIPKKFTSGVYLTSVFRNRMRGLKGGFERWRWNDIAAVLLVNQSINYLFSNDPITWLYQPHGYRNGQKVLYTLLLITVSVNDLGILLQYNRLNYKTLKYSTILIHVALIKHIQKHTVTVV